MVKVPHSNNITGFTLVELAMILVIIGLVVGGVLVGRDLIVAANLRNFIAQLHRTNAAVNAFITKYQYMPGDLPKSEEYGFITSGACRPMLPSGAPQDINAVGCNGDGDWIIEDSGSGRTGMSWEIAGFWYHLSQAGMIDGNYDGSTNTVGVGFPMTELGSNIGMHVYGDDINFLNYYHTPAVTNPANKALTYANNLTPFQASGIDHKLDDGIPDEGMVQARSHAGGLQPPTQGPAGQPFCAVNTTPLSYNVTVSSQQCQLRIRVGI